MFRKRSEKILGKFHEQDIILSSIGANYFGQESLGVKQIRGNGVLILTDYELFFEMLIPSREIRIPLKDITKIDNPKWHLKKTRNRPLLKVYFINKNRKEDSAAWQVRELENWNDFLNNRI